MPLRSAVYGDSQILPKCEGAEGRPLSPYALTKKNNEEYGRLFKELYGFETIGLRYFNVYGPRQDPESQYAAVIPRFITALLSGNRPVIYGSGQQSRDFTFVKDVVQANLLALEAPSAACGAAYNIGRGDQVNLLTLLGTLQSLLNTYVEAKFDPAACRRCYAFVRRHFPRRRDARVQGGSRLTEGVGTEC